MKKESKSRGIKSKTIVIMYHYFYPDDVASARYFTQLAEDLICKGYEIVVLTSNRLRMDHKHPSLLSTETWKNIEIIRVSRPSWDQGKYLSRLISSFIIMFKWLVEIYKMDAPRAFVVGSSPELSQLLFFPIKVLKSSSKIYFWCFDLFPDAIAADHNKRYIKVLTKGVNYILNFCYKYCDGILDLGLNMKHRLSKYSHLPSTKTITPWALVEEHNEPLAKRNTLKPLFNHKGIKILYSGSLSKAHDYKLALKLARQMKAINDIQGMMVFACQGHKRRDLEKEITTEDVNIQLRDFLPEGHLKDYLKSADFIMVSIAKGWEGIVLPSKFFGALALGKPILFFGSKKCEFSMWIKKYQLGFVINEEKDIPYVLHEIKKHYVDQDLYKKMSNNCKKTYMQFFSRESAINNWDSYLKNQTVVEVPV